MTIIAIEGASAVGKSTVCSLLKAFHGFTRIPEVNELYLRNSSELPNWYLDRQVDRWRMACDVSANGGIAVLDGDPLQPLWYNWIYPEPGLQPLEEVLQFYAQKVDFRSISLPDKYYVLVTSESELRRRKEADQRRARRSFDKHLRMIEPQLAYFSALRDFAPDAVSIVESTDAEAIAQYIASESLSLGVTGDRSSVFESMCEFLRRTDPS